MFKSLLKSQLFFAIYENFSSIRDWVSNLVLVLYFVVVTTFFVTHLQSKSID